MGTTYFVAIPIRGERAQWPDEGPALVSWQGEGSLYWAVVRAKDRTEALKIVVEGMPASARIRVLGDARIGRLRDMSDHKIPEELIAL